MRNTDLLLRSSLAIARTGFTAAFVRIGWISVWIEALASAARNHQLPALVHRGLRGGNRTADLTQ
jgi:hypothetical protein